MRYTSYSKPHGGCLFNLFVVCVVCLLVATTSKSYRGRYTRDVQDYEAFVPQKVDEDGAFLSYAVPHFYDLEEIRVRREASPEDAEEKSVVVRFVLPFAGHEHLVELWPSRGVAAPFLVVERRRRDVVRGSFARLSSAQCHYEGRVVGRRYSRAALSACSDGLSGYVFTGDEHFFVEPAEGQNRDDGGRHMHLAYRASARDDSDPEDDNVDCDIERHSCHQRRRANDSASSRRDRRCTVNADWRSAWEARFREEIAQHFQFTRNATPESPSERIRWIETAIFCDKSFVQYHAGKDMDTYVLTLFNIAANIWHDDSIGRVIHLVLIRIMYLDNEEDEALLNINSDAKRSLNSFNVWAQRINPSGDHPNHHDVAILLTKSGLCKTKRKKKPRCQTIGVTKTAQGCNPTQSGCIAQDVGLLTGTTIAHLIGHLMGCAHDSTAPEDSGCDSRLDDGSPVVMAPPMGHVSTWSNCSRTMLELFMTQLGSCLKDEPRGTPYEKKILDMLPGTMYDANYQCWNLLETTAEKCPIWEDKFCEDLWCLVGTSCVSFHQPAADGTPCGAGKWCYAGKCVEIGQRPYSVDGGWSEWSSWSECSRTCGGGSQAQTRACDNPKPARGGYYCQGPHKQYRVCNMQPCDPHEPTYRHAQCSAFDSQLFQGRRYKWKEYTAPEKPPCELVCLGNDTVYSTLSKCAKNGSPCRKGTRDMCIDCECMSVDCAWVIGGKAVEDPCGECNGNGLNCKQVNEFYNQSQKTIGFQQLTIIPKGSYKITIEEKEPSTNKVAIASPDGLQWYLHGNDTSDEVGETQFGSVTGVFTTPDKDREMVVIRGPTKEDLAVLYGFMGLSPLNPGVSVKYNTPTDNRRSPIYVWDFVAWSQCPVVCGGGTQLSNPNCIEKIAGKVNDDLCNASLKPVPKSRKCNPQACPVRWHTGEWSECKKCTSQTGCQTRKVWCMEDNPNPKEDPIHVEDVKCPPPKPFNTRLCSEPTPHPGDLFGNSSHANTSEMNTTGDINLTEDSKNMYVAYMTEGTNNMHAGENMHPVLKNQGTNEVPRTGEPAIAMKGDENMQNVVSESVQGTVLWGVIDGAAKSHDDTEIKEMKVEFSTMTSQWQTPDMDAFNTNIAAEKFPEEFSNLREAPLLQTSLNKNLSDEALRMMEGGELVAKLDTSRLKEYRGKKADERWVALQNEIKKRKNETVSVI